MSIHPHYTQQLAKLPGLNPKTAAMFEEHAKSDERVGRLSDEIELLQSKCAHDKTIKVAYDKTRAAKLCVDCGHYAVAEAKETARQRNARLRRERVEEQRREKREAREKAAAARANANLVDKVVLHISNGGFQFAVKRTKNGPRVEVGSWHFDNESPGTQFYTDKKSLRRLAEMFARAAEAEYEGKAYSPATFDYEVFPEYKSVRELGTCTTCGKPGNSHSGGGNLPAGMHCPDCVEKHNRARLAGIEKRVRTEGSVMGHE